MGLLMTLESTIGEEWSLSTPKCPGVIQEILRVVWLVLGPHHRDSHIQRSWCGGRASKDGLGVPRVAMGVMGRHHGCPGGMELVLRLHQECPRMVKLVMELHHMSQGSNQKEFQDGGASVWWLHLVSSGGD